MDDKYVVCAVWPSNRRKAGGNRYRPWFGTCNRCGIKIALTDDIKRRKQSNPTLMTFCPHCADSELAQRVQTAHS